MHHNQPANQLAKMSASNQIKWYENAEWDAPELNSPQPCIHGAGCVFTVKDSDGKILPGCCRYVHPGEEGTGRRLFPERVLEDGRVQPACVRLTGAAQQFYERRGRKIPWQEWCKQQGIPFTPNKPGEKHEPVQKVAFGVRSSGSSGSGSGSSSSSYTPDATIRAAMDLCQPYTRERHPMQDHASVGGSTAFGLNPRAFDVLAHEHAERSLDPRMMSRGFLGMPGGAEAARIAAGGAAAAPVPQVENRSKIALKNARKRANKKAAAQLQAAAAAAEAATAAPAAAQPYIHSRACLEHSAQRPLAWGPEPEGGCLCAGIRATQAANRAVAAGLRPECQPYEGMSCAYGGSAGCSHCVSEEQREFNLAAEPRGGREYRASPADLDPRMMSRGFLGMPGVAAAAATPQPPNRLSLSGGGSGQKWAVYSRGGECSPDCCCPTGFQCHDRSDTPMMRCNAISCEELEFGLLSAASQIPTPTISAGGAAAPQMPEEDEEEGCATPRLSIDLEKAEGDIDYEELD
jgi:hypothetical protein